MPDGQPLVWALNALGHGLRDRVYGPELMDRACARAAETGQRFYLYGGRNQGALVELSRRLRLRHPGLQIVGGYAPPFRTLTDAEEDAVATDINRSGADVVWVGHRRAQAGEVDGADARRASTPRCWSASAPPSTSTPASCPRRPRWLQRLGMEWVVPARARSRAGCGGATCATTRASWRASRSSSAAQSAAS